MLPLTKGILIAIEGIDGSGKSTLAHNLSLALHEQGYNTLLTKEPGASELGKEIRKIIQTQTLPLTQKAEYLLFAADRAQHFVELIIPAFEQKKVIISDRMSDSSLAYQGYGNGLDLEMIHTINQWTMQHITPDLTIFVRVPVDIALERAKKRGSLSAYEQRTGFLCRVADGFETLYKNRNDVIIVNGMESPETLTIQVCKAIKEWIYTTFKPLPPHNCGLDNTNTPLAK
jgi:dTMP kinase